MSRECFKFCARCFAPGEIITDFATDRCKRFGVENFSRRFSEVHQQFTCESLHAEFIAEIKPPDFGILCEFARHAGAKDAPVGHDIRAIRDA